MKWITREHPKIDRIACPWLIKRFIDKEAIFHYVPFDLVIPLAKKLNATPFDVPDVEHTHYQDKCTFDYFVSKYNIEDPAILTIAKIVRAADTDNYHIAIQAAGLWAISAGMAYNTPDDHELLQKGMIIYDSLYSWATHLQHQKHAENSKEHLLRDIYEKFLKEKSKSKTKKIPDWATELKEIIQDQIDTDFTLSLKEIAQTLQVHPAHLSREFSKYFDNLSFGDYMRKLRIEKAINLLKSGEYSLSEIAYLTGFSDQSYFTRIFKQETGLLPSRYKKKVLGNKTAKP